MIVEERAYKRMPLHLKALFDKVPSDDCVMAEFAKYGETPPRNKEGANKHGESGVFDGNIYSIGKGVKIETRRNVLDSGTPARFFYCAKPSQAERNQDGENNHPTVKSLALMKWLITLITPPGGVVLDCFAGSGSTIRAALELGFDCVGIEQDEEHFATMKRRADGATLPLFAEAA
jgi:DNA modification methylase